MDDVFYTDGTNEENEKKIFNIEEQNKIEKIKNESFNKGYLSKATEFHEDEYNKGFSEGEKYSLEYGKLLGIIDTINFFENNVFQTSKISIKDKNDLEKITKKLEEFKEKLNDDIINSFNQRLNIILNQYINNLK
jgi:flagellar biosynthesis/type III secretory pathway protein FliH